MIGRPFLASYGGGHAQILIALSHELARRGRTFDIMGFTTADAVFRRAGFRPIPISDLIDETAPLEIRARGADIAPLPGHPDITRQQTEDYFTIGLCDLTERFGIVEAELLVERFGRKAFEPVTAFVKYFTRTRPSIVVTTTSPRFETAALRAARQLGIPSLAIGDMYLIAEQEWILSPGYAQDLTVISEVVAQVLEDAGGLSSRIHVLGNPAFDELAPSQADSVIRSRERARLGIAAKTCILWPLGGAAEDVAGRKLLTATEVIAFLDDLCEADPALTYILRPHPNWPLPTLRLRHGRVDADASLKEALLCADLLCVEASTVGLQAVLSGVPTICYNFADYVLYPDFGWAAKTDSLSEMREMILARSYFPPPRSLRDHVGGAAGRIAELMEKLEAE